MGRVVAKVVSFAQEAQEHVAPAGESLHRGYQLRAVDKLFSAKHPKEFIALVERHELELKQILPRIGRQDEIFEGCIIYPCQCMNQGDSYWLSRLTSARRTGKRGLTAPKSLHEAWVPSCHA